MLQRCKWVWGNPGSHTPRLAALAATCVCAHRQLSGTAAAVAQSLVAMKGAHAVAQSSRCALGSVSVRTRAASQHTTACTAAARISSVRVCMAAEVLSHQAARIVASSELGSCTQLAGCCCGRGSLNLLQHHSFCWQKLPGIKEAQLPSRMLSGLLTAAGWLASASTCCSTTFCAAAAQQPPR